MATQPYTQDMTAEQQALADALSSPEQGGAATGIPAGSDVPAILDADAATRQLLQEQVYSRAYGEANPEFVQPGGAGAGMTQGQDTAAGQPATGTATSAVDQGLIDRISALYPEVSTMTEDELAAAEMARIQDQIDAINAMYDVRRAGEGRKGEGRLGQTRAVSSLSGTLYDPFGQGRKKETETYNREVMTALEAERQNLIRSLTNEAAARAQSRFTENSRQAMERVNALTSAITTAYQLNQQEAQALRQEALQRAQMTGRLDGDPTLSYQQYLLDVTTQLDNSARADAQLELQRQQFERSGYEVQTMPDGTLLAIDYRSYPPTTQVIGRYSRPTGGGGGGAGDDGYGSPIYNWDTGTVSWLPKDPTSGLEPITRQFTDTSSEPQWWQEAYGLDSSQQVDTFNKENKPLR